MRDMSKVFFASFVVLAFFVPAGAHAELVARWKFDEGTGSTTVDTVDEISGIFIKGSAGGSAYPSWTADTPPVAYSNPYALSFAGLQDGVQIAWPSALNFSGTAPRSFSFWYKPTADGETAAGNYDRIMSWTSDAFEIAGTLGDVAVHRLAFYDGSWRDTGYNLTVGTWYNITFTYDGTNVKLYVDTDEKFSGTLGGRDQSGNMYIGVRWEVNEGINGIIDDVKVYDHALTFEQIENLTAGSDDPDTPPDETAPTLSAIATSSITTSGATISWTSNEEASTKVVYSADLNFASTTTETDTSTRVTSHSQALSGLLSCTIYNFKVVSRDAAGNAATSTSSSFTTTGCAGSASPSSATTTPVTVSSAATTTLTDANRSLQVVTPANFTATSSTVVIQIKGLTASTVLDSIGKPNSTLQSGASIVFDVKALINNVTELDSFASPVTVTYTYTDADVSGLDESTLSMYHYASGSWTELDDCTVDTAANTITCEAPHFSVFAIFGTAPASSSSSGSFTSSASLPWCSSPNAPGWNAGLPGGGCVLAAAPVLSTPSCAPFSFVRTIRIRMVGEDIRALQRILNCLGFALAEDGPGSPGNETNLFADRTQAALIRFQEAHAADVLFPIGLEKGTGVFAQLSRKKVIELTD